MFNDCIVFISPSWGFCKDIITHLQKGAIILMFFLKGNLLKTSNVILSTRISYDVILLLYLSNILLNMNLKEKFAFVVKFFQDTMPVAETELVHTNPYELIVATILSAQCTDKRVNMITPAFFQKFPIPEVLANAPIEGVFEVIKSCSYPNNKAKNLIGMAKAVVEKFNGFIPNGLDELQQLPGVGRKTANVVASIAFKTPAIAVDTHVFRVAARLGLSTKAKTPTETEKQLMKGFPRELWAVAHHWLILHGRYVCIARRPKCEMCGLRTVCKEYQLRMRSKTV
jgi:endonuclease III